VTGIKKPCNKDMTKREYEMQSWHTKAKTDVCQPCPVPTTTTTSTSPVFKDKAAGNSYGGLVKVVGKGSMQHAGSSFFSSKLKKKHDIYEIQTHANRRLSACVALCNTLTNSRPEFFARCVNSMGHLCLPKKDD